MQPFGCDAPDTGYFFAVFNGLHQRKTVCGRPFAQAVDRRLPDSSFRRIDHADQTYIVPRIYNDFQIGRDILDLFAVIEFQPADQLIRDALAPELILKRTRLRIGPVQNGNVPQMHALATTQVNPADHPLRFFVGCRTQMIPHRFASGIVGPENLVFSFHIVIDHAIGQVQDILCRAVILF